MSRLFSAFAAPIRRRHGLGDYLLVAEAILLLIWWKLALVIMPFGRLARRMCRQPAHSLPPDGPLYAAAQATTRRVGWAVRVAARRGRITAVCFPQGLAVRSMLHRRGIPALVYYGLKKDDAGALKGHVWIHALDEAVIGQEQAEGFTVIATFPPGPAHHASGS